MQAMTTEMKGLAVSISNCRWTRDSELVLKYTLEYVTAMNNWNLCSSEDIVIRYFDSNQMQLGPDVKKRILLGSAFAKQQEQSVGVPVILLPSDKAAFFEIELRAGQLIAPKQTIPKKP
jgi:hypothetical protein